jgi:hypothetical protein
VYGTAPFIYEVGIAATCPAPLRSRLVGHLLGRIPSSRSSGRGGYFPTTASRRWAVPEPDAQSHIRISQHRIGFRPRAFLWARTLSRVFLACRIRPLPSTCIVSHIVVSTSDLFYSDSLAQPFAHTGTAPLRTGPLLFPRVLTHPV